MRSQEERDEQTLLIASWTLKLGLVLGLFFAAGALYGWLT
ncbi:hypothetical protein BJ989_002019 [Nocardioides perillae]|uniref:Uncharacterized protein n=1 Tax=Nocardioides perillae TaxID=1119534 RepID=A0A7Y9RXE1_9ACTN|nr:hypothetical protein [Nocardioides perillae]